MLDLDTILQVDPEFKFDFEDYVIHDLGVILIKPPQVPICKYFLKNMCRMGSSCQYKHPPKGKTVVCKHWLRGLCKKGDLCEFLHEYNLKKMPECWFYTKDCAWYARGFCKHGNECRHKHVRAVACPLYLTGFCPKGENCEFGHPKYELPPTLFDLPENPIVSQDKQDQLSVSQPEQRGSGYRPLEDITCFKCQEKGHYANHCPKRRKFENSF